MDLGLERAGFEPVACLEINAGARETLATNRPRWPLWGTGDVQLASSSLTPKELDLKPGQLDLLAGGPPCQPFSTAAQWSVSGRRGMADKRAGTLHALFDLANKFLPKFILVENVAGFTRGRTSALEVVQERSSILSRLSEHDYVVETRLINAADVGVPQNRIRSITVVRDVSFGWEWPTLTHVRQPMTAWDAIHDLADENGPASSGKWGELLPSIPEGANYQWLTSRGGGEELFGYRTRYWNFLLKLAKSRPSWTLSASPGPAAGPFHWENRPLSTRERMRLQSFPDDWNIEGDSVAATALVGNATPPLLAEVIGQQIATRLTGQATDTQPSLLRSRAPEPPPPTPPAPVPLKYRGLIGVKGAHEGEGKGPGARQRSLASAAVTTVGGDEAT